MVDLEPPPDEYDLPPGKLLTPKFLHLKNKPVPATVDAFLKKLVTFHFNGTLTKVFDKIESQETGIKKSNLATVSNVLTWEFQQIENDPNFQANPNDFYPIELTRQDLKDIADKMKLKPAFLLEGKPPGTAQAEIPQKAGGIMPIPTPQSATWKQITLTVRNYDYTELKYPDGTENRRQKDLGLIERAGKPGKVLTLFFILAFKKGELKPPASADDIKQTVARLRKILRALFPDISGDPLPYIQGTWKTAFRLSADTENLLASYPEKSKDALISYFK